MQYILDIKTDKGPQKRLNSVTFGMKIYWPKSMFECCPWIQMDALRSPLFIYASKTRILNKLILTMLCNYIDRKTKKTKTEFR